MRCGSYASLCYSINFSLNSTVGIKLILFVAIKKSFKRSSHRTGCSFSLLVQNSLVTQKIHRQQEDTHVYNIIYSISKESLQQLFLTNLLIKLKVILHLPHAQSISLNHQCEAESLFFQCKQKDRFLEMLETHSFLWEFSNSFQKPELRRVRSLPSHE